MPVEEEVIQPEAPPTAETLEELPVLTVRDTVVDPAAGTGAYVVGFVIGGSITAAVAVPLADAFGGWRASFVIVSAAAFISLAAWLWLMPRDEGHQRVPLAIPKLPWRRPSARESSRWSSTTACLYRFFPAIR